MKEAWAGWTDENIAELRKLWNSGLSGGLIAKRLGATRNTIIGKVHRLGLDKRKSTCRIVRLPSRRPHRQRWSNPKQPAPLMAREPLPPEPTPPAAALRLTLLQLTDATCKCGLGDPKHADFAFCGLPVKPGSRYCHSHHAVMYSAIRTERAKKQLRREAAIVPAFRFEKWAEAA